MRYEINPDKTQLTIFADEDDMKYLFQAELENGEFDCDHVLWDLLDDMLSNSELQWVLPEETGDLTDAPMLGILGDETTTPGGRSIGRWNFSGVARDWYQPVVLRFAFMDYQVISVQRRLLETGKAVFVGGDDDEIRDNS